MPDTNHDWAPEIRARLASLHLSPSRETEIVDELVQHLDDRCRELVAAGTLPGEAVRIARTEFSGARLTTLLASLRQTHWRGTPPPGPSRALSLDGLLIDVRHAIRALSATPSFTIGALLVLALGTGATTAIFSVVDAVALRPLPFDDPDRIVAVGMRPAAMAAGGPQGSTPGPVAGRSGGPAPRSGPAGPRPMDTVPGAKPPEPDALINVRPQDYVAWVERQQVFESMAAITEIGEAVLQPPNGDPQVVHRQFVTASFFDVLRARPLLGVVFTSSNEVAGNNHVAVLSHGFWQRHLGADPAAVGRTLSIDGAFYTVVGVMAAPFVYPAGAPLRADLWIPWNPDPQAGAPAGALALGGVQSIARLNPGVTVAQAQARLSQVAAEAAGTAPTARTPIQIFTPASDGVGFRPLRDHLIGTSTRTWMLMLLGAVAIVLLIACVNVANLWLARASVQQRDLAVRAALGASRTRLVQRTLVESLLVSIVGTLVGLALAWFGVRLLVRVLPESVAHVGTIGVDSRVLMVAAGAAVATGLLSGLAPAFQGSRPAFSTVLKDSSRSGGTSRRRRRARAVLVVAEVALAVVLLVGAALFIGSFVNVMRLDPGFRADGVLAAQVLQPASPGSSPVDVRPALADIVQRAQQIPGVIDAAAAAPGIPFRVNLWIDALRQPGERVTPDAATIVSVKVVTASYHHTLAIRLERGRYFTDADGPGSEAVVILSDAARRMYFGADDALGRTVEVANAPRRVVGIVDDARQASLEVSPHPEVYVPLAQGPRQSSGFLLFYTNGDPNLALPAFTAVVAQVLPGVPLRRVARFEDLLAAQTAERRLSMLMFGLFGLLGLVISAVGIFGVIAYLVSQQTREIGIRMALGATRSRVVARVFGHVGGLVSVGLLVGGLAAWWMSSATGRFLFGIDPRDPRAYVVAMVTLLVAAFVATLLPAGRAASIDPAKVLQQE